jgi:hypothetical protein
LLEPAKSVRPPNAASSRANILRKVIRPWQAAYGNIHRAKMPGALDDEQALLSTTSQQ